MQSSLSNGRLITATVALVVVLAGLTGCSTGGGIEEPAGAVGSKGLSKTKTNMSDQTLPIVVATVADIRRLQEASSLPTPKARSRAIDDLLTSLAPGPVRYTAPSHYLAFTSAFLQDEGIVGTDSFGLTDGLWSARGAITAILPRQGSDLSRLDPERLDLKAMVQGFHGGEAGSDPEAETAFVEALDVIRTGLRAADEDGALLLLFNRGGG